MEGKTLPLTSKMAVEREDYQALVTAAQKYVVQEKQEDKLKKLLREAKKTIADLKAKIESLVAEFAATKDSLAQYKSVVSFAQRIWIKRMIGFVKEFAPMRM